MKQYRPAIKRGIDKVATKLRQVRVDQNGTLNDAGLSDQWSKYQDLPLADRAVWVGSRLRTQDKQLIEAEMIKFEKSMGKRFG